MAPKSASGPRRSSNKSHDSAAADNAGPAFQMLCGWAGGSLKLSRIDLNKFKNRLRGLLIESHRKGRA